MNTKSSAKQTIDIIEKGYYEVNGLKIDISSLVKDSVDNSVIYTEDFFEREEKALKKMVENKNNQTIITVRNCTTMQAAEGEINEGGHIACLNFASAKNPGGGFLNGAKAQEESLSRGSALYPTQTKFFKEMYEHNRSRDTYLYSDRMIYSPQVVFFKDDNEELLEKPYLMDVLTSPAVNIGAIEQNNRPHELAKAEQVTLERINRMLSVFALHEVDTLILGAWGCGVFRNKPIAMANYFGGFLAKGGIYSKCFKKVIFAVYDRSKDQRIINAFDYLGHLE
ncbi:MAG: TIGR02452 family protein [Dysgonomonas sp.]|nr:TIGR02452 family protein [Dysgonomonas sp.]